MANNQYLRLAAVIAALAVAGCGSPSTATPSETTAAPSTPLTPITPAMWTDYVPFAKQLRWPPLNKSAHPTSDPKFLLQRACGTDNANLTSDGDGSLTAAVSTIGTEPDWQAQELIVLASNPKQGQQIFGKLRTDATQTCASAPNGAQSTVKWDVGPWNRDPSIVHSAQTATIVTGGPTGELHDFLISTACNGKSYVAELAIWADQPSVSWSLPYDPDTSSAIFDSMDTALCSTRTTARQP